MAANVRSHTCENVFTFFCYCHGLHFLTFCIFERFYRENVIKTLVQMLLKMIFCIIFYVVKNAAW